MLPLRLTVLRGRRLLPTVHALPGWRPLLHLARRLPERRKQPLCELPGLNPLSSPRMPLRILTPEDAQAFRELRIETITNDPWGFGWTIEEMRATPLATFARRLSPGDSGDDFVLGLEEEGRLRGCAGFEREPRTR